MALTKGPEAAVRAVANTLALYLPAQLTAIATAAGDGVPLPAPKAVRPFWRALTPELPVVVVSSLDGSNDADLSPVVNELAHRLEVTALLSGDKLEIIEQQSLRYLLAIQEALNTHQQLDGSLANLVSIRLGKYGRSVKYPKAGSSLLMQASWEVVVRLEEQL